MVDPARCERGSSASQMQAGDASRRSRPRRAAALSSGAIARPACGQQAGADPDLVGAPRQGDADDLDVAHRVVLAARRGGVSSAAITRRAVCPRARAALAAHRQVGQRIDRRAAPPCSSRQRAARIGRPQQRPRVLVAHPVPQRSRGSAFSQTDTPRPRSRAVALGQERAAAGRQDARARPGSSRAITCASRSRKNASPSRAKISAMLALRGLLDLGVRIEEAARPACAPGRGRRRSCPTPSCRPAPRSGSGGSGASAGAACTACPPLRRSVATSSALGS